MSQYCEVRKLLETNINTKKDIVENLIGSSKLYKNIIRKKNEILIQTMGGVQKKDSIVNNETPIKLPIKLKP